MFPFAQYCHHPGVCLFLFAQYPATQKGDEFQSEARHLDERPTESGAGGGGGNGGGCAC